MSIATSTAIVLGSVAAGGIGAAGSLIAGGEQAGAAESAAQLQAQEAANSLAFQQQEFNTTEQNEAPYIQQGQGAVNELGNLLGISPGNAPTPVSVPGIPGSTATSPGGVSPSGTANSAAPIVSNPLNAAGNSANLASMVGANTNVANNPTLAQQQAATQNSTAASGTAPGSPAVPGTTPSTIGGINYNLQTGGANGTGSLMQPWESQFQAPTAASAAATPGYQFELQQGENAIQNSAAAQGGLLSGGTAKALDQYANNTASTNYNQVYQNALQQYDQSYNQFQNNNSTAYNQLASLAGLGQTSTAQLGTTGQAAANNVSSTNATAGAQIGQNINNAAAATASGYAGATNAATSGISGINQLLQLQALQAQQAAASNAPGSQSYLLQPGTPGVSF